MSRTFLYARVSTAEQCTDNQLLEARSAGFNIQPRHTVAETISGSIPAAERPGFAKLLDRLDEGKKLGRSDALTGKQKTEIRVRLANGETARGLAKEFSVSHPTILKLRGALDG